MPPLLCACCLSDNTSGSHKLTEFVVVLKKCLNVKVGSAPAESAVCSRCARKLRGLHKFRSQVKSSQDFFKQLNHSTPQEVKTLATPDVSTPQPPSNSAPISLEQIQVKKSAVKPREKLPYKLDPNTRTCPLCRQHFTFFKELRNHMPSHFPHYVCDACGKLCATRLSLQNHLSTHGAAAHACAPCGKVYKKKSVLRDHIRFKHLGEARKYKCRQCQEQFDTYHGRLVHAIRVHGCENKKYKCGQCSKRFNHNSHLHAHTRSEHRKERNVCCDVCGTCFFSKSALRKHLVCHTTEKKHECVQCGKTYPRGSSLKQHLKIHSNNKAYVCSVCGRAFTQKVTLKKHTLTHKPEKPQDVISNLSSMLKKL